MAEPAPEPEPQDTLPGAMMAANPADDEEDTVPVAAAEDGTRSPGKGVAPGKRRRRASVMEMIEEAGSSTKDSTGRVNMIDRDGFDALCNKMGLKLTNAQRNSAFKTLDTKEGEQKDGMLDFAMVHHWLRAARGSQLRETRCLARTLFDMADSDKSGFLDKAEVIQVEERLRRRCPDVVLDPPFDPDADFAMMDADSQGVVSWNEFEGWWMTRTGDDEPTCPVLPESIVSKIDEVCEGSELKGWAYLSERLKVLVDLQRLWGSITELYKLGSSESLYTQDVLPPGIRGPDSTFTRYWDFAQMIFIVSPPLHIELPAAAPHRARATRAADSLPRPPALTHTCCRAVLGRYGGALPPRLRCDRVALGLDVLGRCTHRSFLHHGPDYELPHRVLPTHRVPRNERSGNSEALPADVVHRGLHRVVADDVCERGPDRPLR